VTVILEIAKAYVSAYTLLEKKVSIRVEDGRLNRNKGWKKSVLPDRKQIVLYFLE
jgi:hypothetical protein